MTKVSKADQQLCFAHGIQLAVLDVLYKRRQVMGAHEEVQSDVVVNVSADSDDDADRQRPGHLNNEWTGRRLEKEAAFL